MNLIMAVKKIGIFTIAFLLLVPALFAQKKMVLGEQELYKAHRNKEKIVVDGNMNEQSWHKAEGRSLNYYYKIEKESDKQETIFRMLWDEENLYVFFQCKDRYITARETQRDGAPYYDDCAEIFLIPAPDSLNMHFGFELNLYKTANDFIYLNDICKGEAMVVKAYNPDYKVACSIQGSLNDNSDIDKGWTMEMAIPLSILKGVNFTPVKAGNKWAFLAVRQDRNDAKGERRSTSTIFPIYDISKNVHQPNRFGLVEFVK